MNRLFIDFFKGIFGDHFGGGDDLGVIWVVNYSTSKTQNCKKCIFLLFKIGSHGLFINGGVTLPS